MRIRVRRARPDDSDAVRDITRSTFNGWDYIGDVWDTWLSAPDGAVFAGELEDEPGRAVAIGRLTVVGPSEAWMEGLRVDPRVRGHGVATAFQYAELAWAQAQPQATVVRYATGETNEGSLRLGAKHGFAEAGRWRAIRPGDAPADGDGRVGTRGRLAETGLVAGDASSWALVRSDPTQAAGGHLYEWRAWAWQALTPERFALHAARGEVLLAKDEESWAVGLLAPERLSGETRLVLLGGDVEMALRIVAAVTSSGGRRPIIRLPDASPLLEHLGPRLADGGWRVGEHTLVLMARRLRDDSGALLPIPGEGADRVGFEEVPRPLGLVPAA